MFVCAQSIALGHEIGHGFDAEQHECTVCSVGGGLKHLAPGPEVLVALAPMPGRFATTELTAHQPCSVLTPEARGPPDHS